MPQGWWFSWCIFKAKFSQKLGGFCAGFKNNSPMFRVNAPSGTKLKVQLEYHNTDVNFI